MSGLFAIGTTGEFPSLSRSQKNAFMKLTAREIAGRVRLFVGVTTTCDAETVELMHEAREAGADAAVAMPPYYFAFPDQTALAEYFEDLADRAPMPIMIYHNANYGKGTLFARETVVRLAAHPNIIGIKDSSGSLSLQLSFVASVGGGRDGKRFIVLQGDDFQTVPSVFFGADGGVNSLANVAPRLFVKAYEAAKTHNLAALGDISTPDSLFARLLAIYELYRVPPNALASIKAALAVLGICGETVAKPLKPITAEGRVRISGILAKAGLSI